MRDLFVVFLLTACTAAKAATITAISCGASDVQTAMNLAHAGDTVVMPAGTAHWTQGVSWNTPANVTLKGAGTSATGGGDQTVIIDDSASGSSLITIRASNGFRMTGITLQSGTGAIKNGGTINIAGSNLRIDHCHIRVTTSSNFHVITFYDGSYGVMDHCILDMIGNGGLYFVNGRHRDGSDNGANYEWTLPTNFGGSDYFFVEDNIINADTGAPTYDQSLADAATAGRYVIRFNTVSQAVLSDAHGTGHGYDDRGVRSREIYGNLATSSLVKSPNYAAVNLIGGTALVWGNDWSNGGLGVYKNLYLSLVTRSNRDTYPRNPPPGDWGYAGSQYGDGGGTYANGSAVGRGVTSPWDGNDDPVTGYPCLDQVGRGQGQLLTGTFGEGAGKLNDATGTMHWPNQALEPVYIWNNVGGIVAGWGGAVDCNQTGGRSLPNRDYYLPASGIQTSPTSPFDGTSGTGWGTMANRPATCTPGVAYFATDQGSWNKSTGSPGNPYGVPQNGKSGVLYKCTAPNTWTLYYTPYTYPHPLQKGGASSPSPPTNLHVVQQ